MATAPKAAGIMDLPENEDMNQAPQLSPMESYDAVTTALGQASPDAAAQYEQTMNMSLPPELMEMSAEEIGQLLQLFQYLQDNPEEYPAAIAELIKDGIIDEGDLPPEYDDEVLATVSALLMQALKTKQGGMPQQPQGFAMGGIADAARMVANQGRSGDTMLAHITPEEAQLLRSRGGMGTINPMTGLREFGFFKKIFRGVTKVVKAVVKPIVNVAKEIVKSPIGRIVATVALTTFLGPAAASIGFSTAATAAAVSGGLTAISGGSLKDVLVSSATAYFGAPGGPVSSFVGNLGISNVGAQAALASGISGTAAGLMQGQNLKDSLKGGLTQAAIGAGTAIGANYMSQPPGTRSLDAAIKNVFKPEDVFGDQIGGKIYEPKPLRPEDVAAGKAAEVPAGSVPGGPPQSLSGIGSPGATPGAMIPNMTPNAMGGPTTPMSVPGGPPQSLSGIGSPGVTPGSMIPNMTPNAMGGPTTPMSVPGGPPQSLSGIGSPGATAPAPAAAYDPSSYLDPLKKMGSGIMDIGKGNFEQGFKDLTGGAGDLFLPSGPSQDQLNATARGLMAKNPGMSFTTALDQAKDMGPGIIRTYGPGVAAGIGAIGLMGGFKQPETPPSELQQRLSGTPGEDLIKADPSKYVIGNLPGVEYDESGNIIGSKPWSPGQTLADIRVPSPGTAPGQNLMNAYAPPTYSPTAGGGRSVLQPYNTSSMYANLMGTPIQPRYAAQGGMMGGGIANLAGGGYPRRNGQISGPGTEKSDSIPAMLSDGEFVMTAKAVRGAGNGSRRAGAKKMYALMHQLEQNAARG
jgi:hypothetical protein